MQRYFKGVYGIPPEKYETVNKIIQDEKVSSDKVLYVGDSLSDVKTAQQTGVNFILRKTDNNKDLENCAKFKVNDIEELSKVVVAYL